MRKVLLTLTVLLVAACGGGGGGGSSSSSSPQLATSVADLSTYKVTFADTTKIDGSLETASLSIEQLLNKFKHLSIFSTAFADSLSTCNSNVSLVAIDDSTSTAKYKKHSATTGSTDAPCFISSQEVGNYIAAQAKNLYQGTKKCDIVLLPTSGGNLHCLSVDIPSSLLTNAGDPEFKFSQAFAGISSLKSLGGKITDNGKYFFVAFSDDGTKTSGYDGVYRIDLTGQNPVGQIAYISAGVNPRTLSFDGYQQLENGDMIVTRMDITAPTGSKRRYTYYVGVNNTFPGLDSQQIVLVNSALEFGYDGINSPIFSWAKNNLVSGGVQITDGSSQNIAFSGSQDPLSKVFYFVIGVNGYQNFSGGYFNKLLIKSTVIGNSISFEDFGPTSLSFFGTAGIKSDLSKIYWIKDWTPGQMTLVTRDVSRLLDNTDPTYMPEVETNISAVLPSDYSPTLLYTTENKVFVSAVKSDFYDTNGLMNLRLFAADKVSSDTYWTNRINAFSEIALTGYTGSNFRVESIIPSLVTDKITFRINRISDNSTISLDAKSEGIDVINLGSKGAVSNKQAVVKGEK